MKFWFNCIVHLLTPRGYGFQSQLKGRPDREKHKSAKSVYMKASKLGWRTNEHGIRAREYHGQVDYRKHQAAKMDVILGKGHGWRKMDILEYRLRFWSRFRHLRPIVRRDADILCLGARQGTEVEVLRELGYHRSRGIDLNPGENNQLVSQGDFMNLDFPENHMDVIYSNCLDHALDLDAFFLEQRRVLKNKGHFLIDISTCAEAGHFESLEWARPEDVLVMALKHFQTIILLKREKRWLWVLLRP